MDDVYNHKAREFVRRYEAVDPVQVHGNWIPFLDNLNRGGLILDIGAGSGRDAAWLADHPQKFEVFAVEPARRLRELAKSNHPHPAIHWYADKLPQLKTIRKFNLKFDLILLSAVWMHLPEAQQERAFRVVSDLLKPAGIMVITFRNSVAGEKRRFHPVSANTLRKFARNNALEEILHQSSADVMGRKQLHWTTLVFRLPDDGTGALPLLRNIVINDKKTSTYKMGLLRVISKIADGAFGAQLRVVDGQVYLPLGLVALYWLKAYYRPVLEFKIRQMNRSDNYGFAKDDFYRLKHICTPEELKPGAQFSRKNGLIVARALYAARDNIAKMPANYITYPNSNDIVFGVVKKKKNFKKIIEKAKGGLILDREFLAEFGVFKVPVDLWRAFNRYACWIDPAINQEWISLMQNYEKQRGKRNAEDFYKALQWIDPQRKTADIRKLFRQMQKHSPQYCVWSGKRLRHQFAIDHLFPFAHWPNNDLWNLLPTAPDVNSSKSDKLISAKTLNSSRERILNWFGEAYLAQERTKQQFFEEISFSLPGDFKQTLPNIYPLLSQQRIRLKTNQMLEEWNCI